MPTADARCRGAARAASLALGIGWVALVGLMWFGLFVPSMRPDAPRGIAIDLDGYFLPRYLAGSPRGGLPLWNPFELAGVPFLGTGQAAALYPPRMLLFGILPPGLALHAWFVGHYLLLGVGAFLALRALRLAASGAALGAVIVAFQPFMLHGHYAPHWIANFAWVPLAVAAFLRLVARPGPGPALALGLAMAALVLAGYPEYVLDTSLVLAILLPAAMVQADGREPSRTFGWLSVAAALALGLGALQWIPLLETARESVRSTGDFQFMFGMTFDIAAFGSGLRAWVSALSLLFYVPALGWALTGGALAARRVPYRVTLVALAALCYGATSPLRDLPPFSFFRGPLCWDSILHLPLGALAGVGFDRVLGATGDGSDRRRVLVATVLGATVAAALSGTRGRVWLLIGAAALALGLAGRRRARGAAVAVVLASIAGAILTALPPRVASGLPHRWAGGQPTFPDAAVAVARGDRLRRACAAASGGRVLAPEDTWLGVPLRAGIRTIQGYPESLAAARITRLLDRAGLAPERVLRLDWDRLARADALLALLDVRCVVTQPQHADVLATLGFERGPDVGDGRVAFTRPGTGAFLPGSEQPVADGTAALTAVTADGFDPAAVAVVEGRSGATRGERGRVTSLERPAPGRMHAEVESPSGGWLVVSETWYPGWRARLDGATVAVERADGALLGVEVPPGAHAVELWYAPRGLWLAWTLGAAGLLGVLALGLATMRERRARGKAPMPAS